VIERNLLPILSGKVQAGAPVKVYDYHSSEDCHLGIYYFFENLEISNIFIGACSQESTLGLFLEPDEFSPHPHVSFNIILLSL
jgi:hypothetical protein